MSEAKFHRPLMMVLFIIIFFLPCSTAYAQDLTLKDGLNEQLDSIDNSVENSNTGSQDESQITTDESTSETPGPPVPPTPPVTIDPTDESTTTTREPHTNEPEIPETPPKDKDPIEKDPHTPPSVSNDKESLVPNKDESNTSKQSLAPGSLMVIQDNQLPLNYQLSNVITYLRADNRIIEVSHCFSLVFFNYPMIPSFFHPLYSLAIPVDHYLLDALRNSLLN